MGCCFSSYRRPARDAAPTDAKASCLYPNMQRALVEAAARGFDNAITLDATATSPSSPPPISGSRRTASP